MAEASQDTIVGEVNEHSVDEEKKPVTVAENISHPDTKVDDLDNPLADELLKNGNSEGTKGISNKVLEGQKWNNRNHEKRDYKKNVKSDLTSQEESSDAAAICKQVR